MARVTFEDGPAAGEPPTERQPATDATLALYLSRLPVFLRVVRSDARGWDALDQLDDTPRDDEELWIYVRRIYGHARDVGRFAVYRLRPATPEQRERARVTEQWRALVRELPAPTDIHMPGHALNG